MTYSVTSPDLDRVRDAARAVSAELVAREVAAGVRVRTPHDPGATHFRQAFRVLLTAEEAGIARVNPKETP